MCSYMLKVRWCSNMSLSSVRHAQGLLSSPWHPASWISLNPFHDLHSLTRINHACHKKHVWWSIFTKCMGGVDRGILQQQWEPTEVELHILISQVKYLHRNVSNIMISSKKCNDSWYIIGFLLLYKHHYTRVNVFWKVKVIYFPPL